MKHMKLQSKLGLVGTATRYGLEGPGIESLWGVFLCRPDQPPGPPSLL
jgi:hypothetical protein